MSLSAFKSNLLLATITTFFSTAFAAAPLDWTTVDGYAGMVADQRDMAFNGKGIGLAVQPGGQIHRSTDGGKTWRLAFKWRGFNSVAFVDENTAVAVGYGSRGVYLSLDAGRTWSPTEGYDPSFTGPAIAFGGPKAGLAVGDGGRVLRSIDGGRTWNMLPPIPGVSGSLSLVAFASEQIAMISGEGLFRSTDAGLTWSAMSTPAVRPRKISFATEKIGFIAGGSNTILRTMDAGLSWNAVLALGGDELQAFNEVTVGKDGRGMAVGSKQAWTTEDFGATWSELIDDSASAMIRVGKPYVDSAGWVIGFPGGFRTGSVGQPWVRAALQGSQDMRGLAVRPDGKPFAVGDSGTILNFNTQNLFGFQYQVFRNFGSGHTFANLEAAAFRDMMTGTAVGKNGVFQSTSDGGQTWSIAAQGLTTQDLHAVAFSGSTGCVVGSHGVAFRSTDGGYTWSGVSGGNAGGDLRALAFVAGSVPVAVGDSGRILVSGDKGESWNRIDHGLTDKGLLCVAFSKDGGFGLAGGADGVLLRTRDGGKSWDKFPNMTATDSILSLGISDLGMGVAVFSGTGGVWGFTPEGGKWLRLSDVTGLRAFRFADMTHGFAVGLGGKVSFSGEIDGRLGAPSLKRPASAWSSALPGLVLGWNPLAWAESYRLRVAADPGFTNPVLDTVLKGDSSLSLIGLDTTKGYYWQVTGLNDFGTGKTSPAGRVEPSRAPTPSMSSTLSEWSQWNAPSRINCMAVKDSLLWLGTEKGLARLPLAGGNHTIYTTGNSGLYQDTITHLEISPDDEVLMGTPQGVNILKDGRWTVYDHRNSPLSFRGGPLRISGVARGRDGRLWVSSHALIFNWEGKEVDWRSGASYDFHSLSFANRGRLFQKVGETWTEMPDKPQTTDEETTTIWSLAPDPVGGIWVNKMFLFRAAKWHYVSYVPPRSSVMAYQFRSHPQNNNIFDMQADSLGIWMAFFSSGQLNNNPYVRALLQVQPDEYGRGGDGIPEVITLTSRAGYQSANDLQRFGPKNTLFALDPEGSPRVLGPDSIFTYSRSASYGDIRLSIIEVLPPGIKEKGPFRQIKIDERGIVFLRNDSTVFWKAKSKPFPSGLVGGKPRGLELRRSSQGWYLHLPKSGRVRLKFLSLQGRESRSFDLGIQPAGKVELPASRIPGPSLLKVETFGKRRYFLLRQ